jgi:PAS domain S-box-containing protein
MDLFKAKTKEIKIFIDNLPLPVICESLSYNNEYSDYSYSISSYNESFKDHFGIADLHGYTLQKYIPEIKELEDRWIVKAYQQEDITFTDKAELYIKSSGKIYEVSAMYSDYKLYLVFKAGFNKDSYNATAFERSPHPMMVIDSKGIIKKVNEKAGKLLSVKSDLLIGCDFISHLHGTGKKSFIPFIQSLVKYQFAEFQADIKNKNGIIINVVINAGKVFGNDRDIQIVLKDLSQQKCIEQHIKQNEDQYRLIINNMRDVVWTMNLDMQTTYVSPSIEKFTGYKPEEHYKQAFEERFTESSAQKARQQFVKGLHKMLSEQISPDYSYMGEFEYKHKQGGVVWAEIKVSVLRDDSGKIIGIQGVSRDVTARKRAEKELDIYKNHLEELVDIQTKELKESESRFRSIVQQLTDIICIIDNKRTVKYESPSTSRILGYPPGHFVKNASLDYIHPDDRTCFKNQFEKCYNELNSVKELAFRIKHATKGWIDLEAVANNLLNYTGVNGIVITAKDVTERIKAEKAIRLSEEKLRNIFDSTSDGIVIIDMKGHILEANRRVIEFTKFRKKQLLEKRICDLNIKLSSEQKVSFWKQLLSKGELVFETEYENKMGINYAVEVSSKLISYKGSKAIISAARNLSERKQIDAKIMKAIFETEERERDRIAQDLHDGLGATLSGVKMYLNILRKEKVTEKTKKKEYWNKAFNLLSEAVSSTRQISYLMRPEEISKFGLVAAIDSFIERIKDTTDITVYFDKEKFTVRLPEEVEISLFRVISELMHNTLKHAFANNIHIVFLQEAKKINVLYADDGKGFNNIEKVKESYRGMGLHNIQSRLKSIGAKYKMNVNKNEGFSCTIEINVNDFEVNKK